MLGSCTAYIGERRTCLCSGMQLAGLPGHKVVPAHGSFGGERMLLLGVGCRVVAIRQGATAATSSSQ
jgi:hypothetical protein